MSPTAGAARRLLVALLVAAVGAAAFSASPASAQDQGSSREVLDRDMRGEEAIGALGDRLPEVAARNDMTSQAFRAALRADSMLWVGTTGQLLFVDEFSFGDDHGHDVEHTEATLSPWTSASMPAGTDVFALDSNAEATRVVVLDFNGHDARGTAWGSTDTQIAGPYDSDGDPSSFSTTEQQQIYSVWQRVAEDFAPFDVNVTTRDFPHVADSAGHAAIRRDSTSDESYGTRVVVTPSQTYNCQCGGVAYVGVFAHVGSNHDKYQPAWVFTGGVGNGAKNIAEAASHEAGHNLKLNHDGTSTSGYYRGHGDWAPIMGVGYHEPITQWSKGEYAGANNKEDDLAVMQMHDGTAPRGIVPLLDDVTTAVDLGGTGTVTRQHLIGSAGDTDSFTFSTTGGTVSIDAEPAAVSPNLDLRLDLLQGGGLLARVDPSSVDSTGNDLSVGLDAQLTTILPGGTYTLVLDGVGSGDPGTDGYSDYGSVGRYTLTVAISNDGLTDGGGDGGGATEPEPDVTSPAAPTSPSATAATDGSVTVRWADNSPNETGFEIERQSKHKSGSFRGSTVLVASADATSYLDNPGTGTFRYRIRAVNGALASDFTAWAEVTVSGGGGGGGGNKGGKQNTR